MKENARKYGMRFLVGMATYVILLPVSIILLDQIEDGSPLRVLVALVPVLPVLFLVGAFLRYLGGLDELQRRIQMEALGFSLGLTGVTTFTLGFLQNAGGPVIDVIWVLPMMVFFWGIGQAIATRRYA